MLPAGDSQTIITDLLIGKDRIQLMGRSHQAEYPRWPLAAALGGVRTHPIVRGIETCDHIKWVRCSGKIIPRLFDEDIISRGRYIRTEMARMNDPGVPKDDQHASAHRAGQHIQPIHGNVTYLTGKPKQPLQIPVRMYTHPLRYVACLGKETGRRVNR